MSTKSINSSKTGSCGYYLTSKERSRKNRLWNGHEDIHGKYWNNIKRGAKNRKHPFDITIEYAWTLFVNQNRKCALSGVDIQFAVSTRGW